MARSSIHAVTDTLTYLVRPFRRCSLILKILKLQLLQQLTRWKEPVEGKKTAIYKSRSNATLHILLHLAPVAGCITLCVLNLGGAFYSQFNENNVTALQFVAKVLEVLIQVSISAVTLAFVRSYALREVLPFGAIVVPFSVTDVSTLWSLEFWGALTSTAISRRTRVVLGLFICTSTILANLVGPSAAVLMIPRLQDHVDLKELQISEPRSTTYPDTVGLEDTGTLMNERTYNSTSYQLLTQPGLLLEDTWPSPVTDDSGVRGLNYVHIDDPYGSKSAHLAITPSIAVLRRGATTNARVYGQVPMVSVDCWAHTYVATNTTPNSTAILEFSSEEYVDFGPKKPQLQQSFHVGDLFGNISTEDDNSAAYRTNNGSLSSTILWRPLPQTYSNGSLAMITATFKAAGFDFSATEVDWVVTACTIDTFWTHMWTNLSETSISSVELKHQTYQTTMDSFSDRTPLRIAPSWAKRIFLLGLPVLEATSAWDLSSQCADSWVSFSFSESYSAAQYALALSYVPQEPDTGGLYAYFNKTFPTGANRWGITDQQHNVLLSYIQDNHLLDKYESVTVQTNDTTWTDPSILSQFQYEQMTTGYGYDRTTTTVKLALAVILFYLTCVFTYLIYTIWTGYTATSWNSIGELVALALNSERPKGLDNTSVAIETLETFRKSVCVRANEAGSLELVFNAAGQLLPGQMQKYERVEYNKNY